MKTIVFRKYGPPELLRLEEIPTPIPGMAEVLIRIRAATVNRTDCGILRGRPFVLRFFTGLFKPRNPCTGTDFAGTIEAVGPGVSEFKAGDRVFGFNDGGVGSHAELMLYPLDKALGHIPEKITFAQAAASLEGAHYALNIINKIPLKKGERVLVNGASGAIGSAAVQLLRYYEARVVAVCDTPNVQPLKSMGPELVIDYLKDDFTSLPHRFNYIIDAVGKSSFKKCSPLLYPGGIYISSELGPYWQNLFYALITPLTGGKKVVFPIPYSIGKSLKIVRFLLEKGEFMPLIDRAWPMEEAGLAFNYVESGLKAGNVLLIMPWNEDFRAGDGLKNAYLQKSNTSS